MNQTERQRVRCSIDMQFLRRPSFCQVIASKNQIKIICYIKHPKWKNSVTFLEQPNNCVILLATDVY